MGGIGLADLNQGQHVGQAVQAGPAVLFGHLDSHEAHLAHLADGRQRKFTALVEFGRNRRDLVLSKLACELADLLVLGCESQAWTGMSDFGDHRGWVGRGGRL